MTPAKRSIAARAAVVLGAGVLCCGVASIKAGAIFGSFAANVRARAGMLAETSQYRSARYLPYLAEGGDEYAVVKDAAGTVVWRSPSLGGRSLPESTDEISAAKLPDGREGWVATVVTPRGKATYGSGRFNTWAELLRYAGPPLVAFVLPVAVLAWLCPGKARRGATA